jgi:uncharacterized membrane protein
MTRIGISSSKATFEHAVAGVIVANVALVIAGLVIDGHEHAFEAVHTGPAVRPHERNPGTRRWR